MIKKLFILLLISQAVFGFKHTGFVLIGDSVSKLGQRPYMIQQCLGRTDWSVINILSNDSDGEHIINAWQNKVGQFYNQFDYLIINFGLHDVTVHNFSDSAYRHSLCFVADSLMAHHKKIIWVSTTPVTDSVTFIGANQRVIDFNAMAHVVLDSIMGDTNTFYVDQYALAKSDTVFYAPDADGVHYGDRYPTTYRGFANNTLAAMDTIAPSRAQSFFSIEYSGYGLISNVSNISYGDNTISYSSAGYGLPSYPNKPGTVTPSKTYQIDTALIVADSITFTTSFLVDSFYTNPALTNGYGINKNTGTITGMPITPMDSTPYWVIASNSAGSDSCQISLRVISIPVISSVRPYMQSISMAAQKRGATFKIHGRGFRATQGTGTTYLGSSDLLTAAYWSDSLIIDTIPVGWTPKGIYNLIVKNSDNQRDTSQIRVLIPTITRMTP